MDVGLPLMYLKLPDLAVWYTVFWIFVDESFCKDLSM